MNLLIKQTSQDEFYISKNITREAFWNVYKPGCSEHLVLHNLRKSQSYVKELDLVAICDHQVVGNIISTKAKIVDPQNNECEILCVGPLSVLPGYQKRGIGGKLLTESIRLARALEYRAMVLFGNPEYYHRFGFKNAVEYSITTKDDQNFEPFMALELFDGALSNVRGRFYEDESFMVNEEELSNFEGQFSYKEKQVTITQIKP